jgi:hypothetical protein
MPLLLAGGGCCCAAGLDAGAGVVAGFDDGVVAAGAEAGAALVTGVGFGDGVETVFGEAAGVAFEAAAGVAESAEADFLERVDFFFVEAEESAADAEFALVAAEASVEADFLDLELFFDDAAVEFEVSAAGAESAESAFFERLLDFGLAEVAPAAAELEFPADASDFLDFDRDFDLEVVAVEESDAVVPEDGAASAAVFFLDFFFGFVLLESV